MYWKHLTLRKGTELKLHLPLHGTQLLLDLHLGVLQLLDCRHFDRHWLAKRFVLECQQVLVRQRRCLDLGIR